MMLINTIVDLSANEINKKQSPSSYLSQFMKITIGMIFIETVAE